MHHCKIRYFLCLFTIYHLTTTCFEARPKHQNSDPAAHIKALKKTVQELLTKNDLSDLKESPLNDNHFYHDKKMLAQLSQLLKLRANPNLPDSYDGLTPLFSAIASDKKDAVELLLHYGANPNSIHHMMYLTHGAAPVHTLYPTTPLIFAIELGNTDIVDTLLRHGTNAELALQENNYTNYPLLATIGCGRWSRRLSVNRCTIINMLLRCAVSIDIKNILTLMRQHYNNPTSCCNPAKEDPALYKKSARMLFNYAFATYYLPQKLHSLFPTELVDLILHYADFTEVPKLLNNP